MAYINGGVSRNPNTISLRDKDNLKGRETSNFPANPLRRIYPLSLLNMISVVIITELLLEYTAALAKLTAGILPRRRGDGDVVRIGGFSLRCPPRSSPIPDFSSHLVDF
ncbi:unnamed protein product [Brassica rapa]|nr:uncharacterized protein LOC125579178 [Brassica napus]CAF2150346.1 unnamed protein product [Brassica napus]CAG7887860.1 unnamed protein product [Brassica rapa]